MKVVGAILWLIVIWLIASFAWGVRKNTRSGFGVTMQTVNTAMLFAVQAVVVGLFGLNPLHFLWMIPLAIILGSMSLAFPFSLLSVMGNVYANLCCFGLDRDAVEQNKALLISNELFGRGTDKNALIKELVLLRLRNNPIASASGFNEDTVNSLSGAMLAGLPEVTILTIVETWILLDKKGVPESAIFSRLEDHRSRLFPRGQLPVPLNLINYVKYRLKIEHSHGGGIDKVFIESAIEAAKKAYA